eukprot:12561080-Heterocapsa_arctica.AAC.1
MSSTSRYLPHSSCGDHDECPRQLRGECCRNAANTTTYSVAHAFPTVPSAVSLGSRAGRVEARRAGWLSSILSDTEARGAEAQGTVAE